MSTNMHNPADHRIYPDRWPRYRGKQLFEVIDDKSETGEEELLSVSHITGITPRSQKTVNMFQSESLVGYKRVQVGDIAANTMWTWQGAIGVSEFSGVVSPAYNVYRQRGDYYNPRFLDLLLREPSLVDVYASLSTGIQPSRLRLYPGEFLTIDLPVPPKDEQDQIVRYLSWKASEINQLIRTKLDSIRHLTALKNVLIKECVLGRNYDSDEMTDTNTLWFGSMPARWEYVPIKRLFTIVSGATPKSGNDEYWDGEIAWITPSDYKTTDKFINRSERSITNAGYQSCSTHLVPPGSLVISKRAPVGTVAISGMELCTSQGCLSCIPNNKANAIYYYYLMSVITDVFEAHASGTTFKEISATTFGSIKVPCPSISEQTRIATELEESCATYDKSTALLQRQIADLVSLRNRVISDVITGKTDTRQIEIPEFTFIKDSTQDANESNSDYCDNIED